MAQFNDRSVKRIVDTVLWKEAQVRDVRPDSGDRRYTSPAILVLPGQNQESEEIPPFSVVEVRDGGLVDGMYLASLHQPTATGKVFGLTGRWEIGTDPDDRGGYHCEAGLAKYAGAAPAVGTYLGPKPGQWTLDATGYGFQVVGVYDTVERLALVRPVSVFEFGCVLTSDISEGTATADITELDDYSSVLEEDATIYSTGLGDGIFDGGVSGADGIVERRNGKWMLKQLRCTSA